MLLLACGELLLPAQRARLDARAGEDAFAGPLGDELTSLRAQVVALRDSADEAFAEESRCELDGKRSLPNRAPARGRWRHGVSSRSMLSRESPRPTVQKKLPIVNWKFDLSS